MDFYVFQLGIQNLCNIKQWCVFVCESVNHERVQMMESSPTAACFTEMRENVDMR